MVRARILTSFVVIAVVTLACQLTRSASAAPISPKVYFDERVACETNFRLDAQGGPLAEVFLHNQGTVPNCYAQTAATMFDAWGLSHPFPVGYFNRAHRASPYQGTIKGLVEDSLRVLENEGSCDERAYSQWVDAPQKHSQTTAEYENQFNRNYFRFFSIWSRAQGKDEETIRTLAYDFNRQVSSYIFPAGVSLTPDYAYGVLKAPSVDLAIRAAFAPLCNNSEYYEKLSMPEPKAVNLVNDRSDISISINEVWNQELANPQPVGLTFCAAAFTDRYFSIPRGEVKSWDGCDSHAATLIGRRWSETRHQCEFLLRNSWGYQCATYDTTSVVECEEQTKEVWVNASWINRAVLGTVHVGP